MDVHALAKEQLVRLFNIIITGAKDALVLPESFEVIVTDPFFDMLVLISDSRLKAVLFWQVMLHLLPSHKSVTKHLELVFFCLE